MLNRTILLVAAAAALAAAEARADELQNRVVAAMRASRPDAFRFQRTSITDRTGSARTTVVEQYDPGRPAALRWQLVSVDGRAPTAKEAEKSRKAKRGPDPSYAELAKWFGAPATRSEPTPGYVTYRFARLPAGSVKIGSHDASADTQAEAWVNVRAKTPFVERVRFTSTKGFRMMMVASVKSMDVVSRFALLPGGQVVPSASETTLTGSLLGKSGRIHATASYAAFQPVR
ncbi:hypothetical protein [Sphingomonas sp. ACRSK]|uniref:hypothetical protein n=1 Tax=Sphingomonas sp. ACRSK TaxID=2918213 RepID=UPI001EF58122|nr:hypothetical protein [Sphingomonas sp. ACRSK]